MLMNVLTTMLAVIITVLTLMVLTTVIVAGDLNYHLIIIHAKVTNYMYVHNA